MDNNGSLTPPWYTLRNEFFYTFGNNPLIAVKQLNRSSSTLVNSKNYLLEIIAKEDDLSFALRQVIKPNFNFGLINVQTIVKNSMGTIEKKIDKNYDIKEVADLFCTALKNNSLFKGTVIKDDLIFLIFEKSIIQFFNDDISDLCQNYNQIASVVFNKLSINKFKNKSNPENYFDVYFNTYSDKCIRNKDFYCSKINSY